jgi:hypothetical protein
MRQNALNQLPSTALYDRIYTQLVENNNTYAWL